MSFELNNTPDMLNTTQSTTNKNVLDIQSDTKINIPDTTQPDRNTKPKWYRIKNIPCVNKFNNCVSGVEHGVCDFHNSDYKACEAKYGKTDYVKNINLDGKVNSHFLKFCHRTRKYGFEILQRGNRRTKQTHNV